MRAFDALVVQSRALFGALSLRAVNGRGSALKKGLQAAGFEVGDLVVIVLKRDLERFQGVNDKLRALLALADPPRCGNCAQRDSEECRHTVSPGDEPCDVYTSEAKEGGVNGRS